MNTQQRIVAAIANNPIVIFMKGTPQHPQCGFSMRAAQALQACGVPFAHVDILADIEVGDELPDYSNWPTFPQIFIKGELVGGCDIVVDLYQRGELQRLTREATGA
ncbi:MAG: Grx4 family monothiol glutaredoxin [Gammaproteobacteria bacterium]|nr:Grx4 family monothiol glutaredoxin [Gammaproteobacteria bacterium]